MNPRAPKRAVYTALIGQYEQLVEQPSAKTSEVRFICFSDDPELSSSSWDVRHVEPAFPGDPVRSARALKIRGHADLAEFEETLWIDNRILLLEDPAVILDDWLGDKDFAVPWHSFRGTVASEFAAVLLAGYDDSGIVAEQFEHYEGSCPDVLRDEVLWTALLARRPDRTSETMQIWLDQVLRYSRRDQLSLPYALRRSDAAVRIIEIDNIGSTYHRWTDAQGRTYRPANLSGSLPVSARLAHEIDEVSESLLLGMDARERQIEAILGSRTYRLASLIARIYQRLRRLLGIGK